MVERYWDAIQWDFQKELDVNALDYFAAPCRCGQCKERYGTHPNGRYVTRRTWDQFLSFYETLLSVRGSYVQSMYMTDPDVIKAQLEIPDEDWRKPYKPPLFGWTKEIEALYHLSDQVQAGRVREADQFKPHPRPVIPVEQERKARRERKQTGGVDEAMQRGLEMAAVRGLA